MKMIIAIVQDQDLNPLQEDLTEKGFRMTNLASTGGFLRSGNSTLLIGVEEEKLEECLKTIEDNCKSREITTSVLSVTMPGDAYIPFPMEVLVGGATVFILDVVDFVRM